MFGRRKQEPSQPVQKESPGTLALMAHVRSQRAENPLLGAQIAGKEILQHVVAKAKNERGVQIELLATILGGLAGRASLLAAVDGQAGSDSALNKLTINTVGTADGRTFLFGDAINRPLAGTKYSVYGLISGYLQSIGELIPDPGEFFARSAQTLGKPEFGIPRYAEGTGVPDTPLAYANVLWPIFAISLKRYAPDPQLWPIAYGIAIQEMLAMAKGSFDLQVLVRVVMDSALAVAHVPVPVKTA